MVTYQYGPKNTIKQYVVIARERPGKDGKKTPLYRMKIFAPNTVVAKSRFFYFISKLKKVKKSNAEVISVTEVEEKDVTTIKNYAIWIRYNSRSGIHNMYKEYRDVTLVGAVNQMFSEMASRHKAKFFNISIIKTAVIENPEDLRRSAPYQFAAEDKVLRFPLLRRAKKVEKKYKSTFAPVSQSQFGW